MDKKKILAKMEELNKEYVYDDVDAPQNEKTSPYPVPTDLYEKRLSRRKEMANKPNSNGSRPQLLVGVRAVVERLAPLHKKASDDSDLLKERGDKQRAEMVKQQYIEESFLPAIESLVIMSSPEEVLNNKQALRELDKYASLGNMSGRGFTASFIRTLHDSGVSAEALNIQRPSDATVEETIKDITRLANNDNIRGAVTLAKKIKSQIDSGKNIASDEDYELIERVVYRGTPGTSEAFSIAV